MMSIVAATILTPAGLLVSFLPRRLELALGRLLGRVFLFVDPKRRKIAEDNIRRCLPELSPAARKRLLRENYEHYGVLALEILHMFSPIPGHYRRYTIRTTTVEGLDNWRRARERAGSAVIVTGHFANWELMSRAGIEGLVCVMATRRLKPEWVHRKIEAARKSANTPIAYGKRILPTLIRELKEGRSVGFVLDQYAPPPMGVPAKFFGVTVDTQAVVGLLVQRTGAAVVPIFQRRDADGTVRIVIEPEMRLPDETVKDLSRCAEALAGRIESYIRANPAQWLWVHRRFKNVVWPAETASVQ